MQRRSSLGCIVSLIVVCCTSLTASAAGSPNVAGLSQWDVTSFQVNLLNHYGANGDVQSDQNGWVHLGANHLEGGDMTYNIQVGRLAPTDILEVWVDGYSSSNDLDVGPTLFIGAGKNRFEQITRMSGDAWRPFVFRFADDRLYGDVTDPSNRNENWRIRYPSSKYEVRRIDKAPNELLEGATLPVRISMTGIDDFILKRLEVVVYRSGGGSGHGQLAITSLAPYKVFRGNRVTVQFNQALPEKDVDFFLVDSFGRESRIYPQITSAQRDSAWFYADGEPFARSGDYMVKVVDRSGWDQAQSDAERFEYVHPQTRVIVEKPKPIPTPDACALPPCPPLTFAPAPVLQPAPVMQPAQIMPVVPSAPFTQVPILAGPPTDQFGISPQAVAPRPNQQTGGAYTIQIAAVSSQQAAFSLMNTLRAQGYDAYVQTQGNVYRVRVGRYPTRNHAAYDATRLQQNGFDIWITTLS